MPHTFISDVDEIAQGLIDAYGLVFEEHEQHLSDPLLRWIDYRLRYIEPSPRQTLKSTDFEARVPSDARPALDAFIGMSEAGANLNPYQTKTINRNDTSGAKRQLRTDGLWADWGIHHAHLTEVPLAAGSEFSQRSEWLLFFKVTPDQLALIDVRSHSEPNVFQAVDLVERAIRSWPQFAGAYAVKGVLGLERSPATDPLSVKTLREGGIAQMLEVDGVVYMPPGLGMTTAATSMRVSLLADRVRRRAAEVGDFLLRPESPFVARTAIQTAGEPTLSLRVTPQGGLAVASEQQATFMRFPSPPIQGDALSEIEELLLPTWAGQKLVGHQSASSLT